MIELPHPNQRMYPRYKAEIVKAVNTGLLTFAEACDRYNLTAEEFGGWWRAYEKHGEAGLRITRAQDYRKQEAA